MSRPNVPRGFMIRIRSDCREIAIVRVLLHAVKPMTAAEIGKEVGLSGNEVAGLLQTHTMSGAVIARREDACGGRRMRYELAEGVRASVAAEVGV